MYFFKNLIKVIDFFLKKKIERKEKERKKE